MKQVLIRHLVGPSSRRCPLPRCKRVPSSSRYVFPAYPSGPSAGSTDLPLWERARRHPESVLKVLGMVKEHGISETLSRDSSVSEYPSDTASGVVLQAGGRGFRSIRGPGGVRRVSMRIPCGSDPGTKESYRGPRWHSSQHGCPRRR